MRNEENWNNGIRGRFIKQNPFTPRIKKILLSTPDIEWQMESTYLFGDTGTGKTVKACQFILAVEKQNYLNDTFIDAAFISVPQLMFDINTNFDHEKEIIEKYMKAGVTVLDDIGIGKPSDWLIRTLYLIINHRYEHELPTIITANVPLTKLSELLDDRITSRIARSYKIIEMTEIFK